jgi:sporulation protein YlmC with PRC-barrel domain
MNRLASELMTRGVIVRQESALVGRVQEVVINPENGQFLGFIIREGFGKGKLKALAEKDILGFNKQFILIPGYNTLGEIDEIVRIKNTLDQKIPIIKNKVYTISGIYLGKVVDFALDFGQARLARLYVESHSIKRFTNQLVVNSACIVSIKKDKITVDDTCVKNTEKAAIKLASAEKDLVTN